MTRFGWLAFVLLAASCGGGAEVLGPSHFDTGALDVADAGRDPGRDPGRDRPGPDQPGPDGADPDASDPGPDGNDLVPPDDGAATDDVAATDDGPAPDDDPVQDDGPAPDDGPPADDGPGDPGADVPAPSLPVRLVAANLTSGSGQSYDPGDGIRILQSLRGDVILVQEFNYGAGGDADYREMTDRICGPECQWVVGNGSIPNGVVSRWPIVEHGAWDDPNIGNRDLDWARIDLPGARDLVAVSVHLHTDPAGDQVQAAQVVAAGVRAHRAANPGCCWYAVGGDFNGPAAVSAQGFGESEGEDVFFVAPPHPVGQDGNPNTNRNRNSPYDWVLPDTDLHAFQVPVVFLADDGGAPLSYPAGLVFDTRDFTQAQLDTYFPPAQTGDSAASGMQHMAVVKDFRVP